MAMAVRVHPMEGEVVPVGVASWFCRLVVPVVCFSLCLARQVTATHEYKSEGSNRGSRREDPFTQIGNGL